MVGHFISVYRSSESFFPAITILDKLLTSRLEFLTNAGYWLYLFFVISGYLVACSKLSSFADVLRKSLVRFFRLAFPILFAYFVIFVLYKFIGFHNFETSQLFQCTWYQQYYRESYSLMDVLLGPFNVLLCGNSPLNAPYWVLRQMLISSVLIYFYKYIHNILTKRVNINLAIAFNAVVVLASMLVDRIITAHLIGMTVALYQGEVEAVKKSSLSYLCFIVIAVLLCMAPNEVIWAISFVLILLCIPHVKWLDRIFSSNVAMFLGNISWGIYSFHWPVFCSIGAITMIKFATPFGLIKAFLASWPVTILCTLLLSTLFYYSFEKISAMLVSFINKKLVRSRLE